MTNPYEALYGEKEAAALGGGRVAFTSDASTLSDRLRRMAYYLTENQKTGADALFVMDLQDAARKLSKSDA